ncbi:hypothetical protein PQC55_gp126 [Escherichia phage vB_EcoP-CHD5UKE1]|uniref:Uncharacterized protein n=1 Tax=Escherichia phage vB_EcoP-CHD5UKE1 TaxID=2865805 RepID=A0ABX9AH03_9CAUD|nr:hypothetical protein PQC55_gp126 [Escherichia phage vB_EcoP-CHD5UKE1]QZI80632.1 hypothetical protein CHD5UKE1_136 [Escherichia phage vB_EcoP-CHD5UKE1]DAF78603.1 MAG TPA: hypothetical protein [Caudoviricetes sp.]
MLSLSPILLYQLSIASHRPLRDTIAKESLTV